MTSASTQADASHALSIEPATVPMRVPPQERNKRLSRGLSEAARRLRFSTAGRALLPTNHRRRRRKLFDLCVKVGGFVALVAGPTLAAIVYFGFIASDQYMAEARFAVRGGAMSGLDPIGSLTGMPSIQVVQDTQVVTNYIHSRAIVELLERDAQLKTRYAREETDWLSRLNPDKPIEKIAKFWNNMSTVSIEMPGGIVNLRVHAFKPQDAVDLANVTVAASERLVNEMNDRAQRDAVANAHGDLKLAGDRLAQARAALEVARNREGLIDTSGEMKKTSALLSELRTQQLEMQAQYETLSRSLSREAPGIRNLRSRLDAIAGQIAQVQAELTRNEAAVATSPGASLSGAITRLGPLELERSIAEKQYASAALALERAEAASRTKRIYLTSFVNPVLPEDARYPRRVWSVAVVLAAGLVAWACLIGAAIGIRNVAA